MTNFSRITAGRMVANIAAKKAASLLSTDQMVPRPATSLMAAQDGKTLRTNYFSGTNKTVSWLPSGEAVKAFSKNWGLHQAVGWIGLAVLTLGLLGACGILPMGGASYLLAAAGGVMVVDSLVAQSIHIVKMLGKNKKEENKQPELKHREGEVRVIVPTTVEATSATSTDTVILEGQKIDLEDIVEVDSLNGKLLEASKNTAMSLGGVLTTTSKAKDTERNLSKASNDLMAQLDVLRSTSESVNVQKNNS